MVYLLIGYMWLFIHRPFEIWPVLGTIRLELVYMMLTVSAWLLSGRPEFRGGRLQFAVFSFATAVGLCWAASPWAATERSVIAVSNYYKLLLFYIILVSSVRTEKELRLLVAAFLCVMMLFMMHSLREFLAGRHVYRMGIARLVGVGESLSDPNSYSATVIYALPLLKPFWYEQKSRRKWLALLAYVVLSVVSIILTGSRTAFMAILILSVLLIWRSPHRLRALTLGLALVPTCWFALPTSLQDRFYTLIDPSVGPANAQTSAEGRNEGWKLGFQLLGQFPATGCGPGAWIPATGNEIESHVLYAQVMGEMGVIGIGTFGFFVFSLFQSISHIKAECRRNPRAESDFLYHLADGIGLALIMLLFEGLGGHNLYRFNWLWYGGFLVLAKSFLDLRVRARDWNLTMPTVGMASTSGGLP